MLGVTRRSLYRLIEKFGLHVPAGETSLAEEPADA